MDGMEHLPEAQPVGGERVSTPPTSRTYLRVKAAKVTQLLDLVGELGLAASGVTRHPGVAHLEMAGWETATHRLENLVRELQDVASSLRLVPVGAVFKRMQRLVRDLAQQTGKPLNLVLQGEAVEVDKTLVDQLYDPLMHLVRNGIDHGIEPAGERLAAGKPAQGTIILTAVQHGREIHVTVADDGRGLDRQAILAQARTIGLVDDGDEPDDRTVWGFIFHSGLSTAEEISSLSGRGVGLDVVQAAAQALRGRVVVDSRPGEGTSVTLCIPLTLAFLDSMVVRLGERLYALPLDIVHQVFQPAAAHIVRASADGSETVRLRDDLTPVCRLARFYEEPETRRPLDDCVLVVVQTTHGSLAIPVDEVTGQQQVTMKPLQGAVEGVRAGAGYALLSTGEVAIILDCEALAAEVMGPGGGDEHGR